MTSQSTHQDRLLRVTDIVGKPEVTEEQAARNRLNGKGPKRPTKGKVGLISMSAATLWRHVRRGAFPKPIRLGGVTAWRESDILKIIKDQG